MGAAVSHEPLLKINPAMWRTLLEELHHRTGEVHESGAFLLGCADAAGRTVTKVLYYDELDPHAYRTGVVVMHAASFGPLWDICRANNLSVVADIHVHPKGAWQSRADRENPMIAKRGHLALIVPWFARPPVLIEELGFFEYRGAHKWRDLGGPEIARHLRTDGTGSKE
jgi:proteasome lid subunit RPN8/RPN11